MAKPKNARRRDLWFVRDRAAFQSAIAELVRACGGVRRAAALCHPVSPTRLIEYRDRDNRREVSEGVRFRLLRAAIQSGRAPQAFFRALDRALELPLSVQQVQTKRAALIAQHLASGGILDQEAMQTLSAAASATVGGKFPAVPPELAPRARPAPGRTPASSPPRPVTLVDAMGRVAAERIRAGSFNALSDADWAKLPLNSPVRVTRRELDALLRDYRGTLALQFTRAVEPVSASFVECFEGVSPDQRYFEIRGADRREWEERSSERSGVPRPLNESQEVELRSDHAPDDTEFFTVQFRSAPRSRATSRGAPKRPAGRRFRGAD